MKLQEYLDKYQTPIAALARRAGVCQTTLRYILYGKDIRLSVAKAVADATHGEVSLEELASRKGREESTKPKARIASRFVKKTDK